MIDIPEDYDEEDSGDEYSEDIEGWWELYNEKEHADKCMFGNQQEVTFNKL